MKFLIFLSLFFTSYSSFAYIPPYWMIMSRTADNHGKGVYVVEQELQFQVGEQSHVIHERWTIQNEQSMRLEVVGRKNLKDQVRLTYVYQNGRRVFVDENGVRKSEKIPADFFEPFFHFRLSKNIKPLLVHLGITPSASLKSEPHKYTEQNPVPDPEPYVRLSRFGGVINYAIGTPTPVTSSENYPGLWIEQDQFIIRKLRLPSQIEIEANNYKKYSGDLWLPNERMIRWNGLQGKLTVLNVQPTNLDKKMKENLDPSSLNFGAHPEVARLLPAIEIVKDFYSRMR